MSPSASSTHKQGLETGDGSFKLRAIPQEQVQSRLPTGAPQGDRPVRPKRSLETEEPDRQLTYVIRTSTSRVAGQPCRTICTTSAAQPLRALERRGLTRRFVIASHDELAHDDSAGGDSTAAFESSDDRPRSCFQTDRDQVASAADWHTQASSSSAAQRRAFPRDETCHSHWVARPNQSSVRSDPLSLPVFRPGLPACPVRGYLGTAPRVGYLQTFPCPCSPTSPMLAPLLRAQCSIAGPSAWFTPGVAAAGPCPCQS